MAYRDRGGVTLGMGGGKKLARVDLDGLIMDSEYVTKWLKKFSRREDVKGIILRIDSQGGAVGPSQEIYSLIRRLKSEKPIVASLGNMATSGGYYVASAATRIFSNPGTLTGNVGVILGYTHVERLLAKAHVDPVVIKSGARKDLASPLRAPSSEDLDVLQKLVDDVHKQFLSDVVAERRLTPEALAVIADGRPVSGAQALDLGLVDELGSYDDAVDWLKQRLEIEGEPEVVRPPMPRPSILDWLTGEPEDRFAARAFKNYFFFGSVLNLE